MIAANFKTILQTRLREVDAETTKQHIIEGGKEGEGWITREKALIQFTCVKKAAVRFIFITVCLRSLSRSFR